MPESITLTVNFRGVERPFEATLLVMGYIYKFQVMVEETPVLFEKDEEGVYRAVIPWEDLERIKKRPDPELLKALANALQTLFQ